MHGNILGSLLTLSSYGETQSSCFGAVLDGCPSGIVLSEDYIQSILDHRNKAYDTEFNLVDDDKVKIISGVFAGRTTGTPIALHIHKETKHSDQNIEFAKVWRPSEADKVYDQKYGFRDSRGGGRSSGAENISCIAAGAIASAILNTLGVKIYVYTTELAGISSPITNIFKADERKFYAADEKIINKWSAALRQVKIEGDTVGAKVKVEVHNLPAGLGEPIFDKLDARLAYAMLNLKNIKGIEFGVGYTSTSTKGSENNDFMTPDGYVSNHSGGTLGGISTGEILTFDLAIKPLACISQEQLTITSHGEATCIQIKTQNDLCAVPRIIPAIKAMTALTLADMYLLQRRMLKQL